MLRNYLTPYHASIKILNQYSARLLALKLRTKNRAIVMKKNANITLMMHTLCQKHFKVTYFTFVFSFATMIQYKKRKVRKDSYRHHITTHAAGLSSLKAVVYRTSVELARARPDRRGSTSAFRTYPEGAFLS